MNYLCPHAPSERVYQCQTCAKKETALMEKCKAETVKLELEQKYLALKIRLLEKQLGVVNEQDEEKEKERCRNTLTRLRLEEYNRLERNRLIGKKP